MHSACQNRTRRSPPPQHGPQQQLIQSNPRLLSLPAVYRLQPIFRSHCKNGKAKAGEVAMAAKDGQRRIHAAKKRPQYDGGSSSRRPTLLRVFAPWRLCVEIGQRKGARARRRKGRRFLSPFDVGVWMATPPTSDSSRLGRPRRAAIFCRAGRRPARTFLR